MLNEQISIIQVQWLAREVASCISSKSIKRGFEYYRKGRIINIDCTPSKIKALVHGNYDYLVSINLNDFHLSRCSCPVNSNCKHMAAVFFYVSAIYEEPKKIYQELLSEQLSEATRPSKAIVSNSSQIVPPEHTGSVLQWQDYFEKTYQFWSKSYYHNYNYSFYLIFLDNLTQTVNQWPTPEKDLFLFHGYLFTMHKMERFYSSSTHYYYKMNSYQNESNDFFKLLIAAASKFRQAAIITNYSGYFQAALDTLRTISMQDGNIHFEWLYIYRILWTKCFNNKLLIARENVELKKLNEKTNTPMAKQNIIWAMAHFQLMAGQDQLAKKTLAQIRLKTNNLLFYLQFFAQNKQWERMEQWLQWLVPQMDNATAEEISAVCEYWLELAEQRHDYTDVLTQLKCWLPKSSGMYEKSLIVSKQYKTWVHFHIYNQSLPTDIGRDEIKQVESFDTALLLPLYHQFAYRLIQHKTRNSYKMAVRSLKKLRTYYKKLKRSEEWEQYIIGLTNQYKRLRALQEELRKGKLI